MKSEAAYWLALWGISFSCWNGESFASSRLGVSVTVGVLEAFCERRASGAYFIPRTDGGGYVRVFSLGLIQPRFTGWLRSNFRVYFKERLCLVRGQAERH